MLTRHTFNRHRPRKRAIQYSRDVGDRTEEPQRTGYPACAGMTAFVRGRSCLRAVGSLLPCGGELEREVATRTAVAATPLPNPPPQGGGERSCVRGEKSLPCLRCLQPAR